MQAPQVGPGGADDLPLHVLARDAVGARQSGHRGVHRLGGGFKTANEVSTDSAPGRAPSEPYPEEIEAALGLKRNGVAIYQDLVTRHGFTAKYASVRRFIRKLRGDRAPGPFGVITTAPGEEVQVDYGDGPMVRDAATGKSRRVRLFALTLAYNQKAVRLLTPDSSTKTWAQCCRSSILWRHRCAARHRRVRYLRGFAKWRAVSPPICSASSRKSCGDCYVSP